MDGNHNDGQDAHPDREPKRIKLDVADDAEQGLTPAKPSLREKGAKRGRGRGRGRGRDNWKSRDWAPRTEARAERIGADAEDAGSSKPRLPKRKCALLMGFCGTGFSGMQRQPNSRTIEGELFDALVKAGAISQDNADDPSKSQLQRSARTDAGVHAAGNVVSIKIITEVPGVPDLVAHINDLLPPSIRIWSIVRIQNSFSARTTCDSRKYTYVFPSHILLPPKPGSPLYSHLQSSPAAPDSVVKHPFWTEAGTESSEEELRRKRQWRVDPATLDTFRAALSEYHGTHNFHNFTVQKEFEDKTTSRFIKTTEVPAPSERDGIEWVSVLFHGQSFMLHQIRKMISAALLLARTGTPPALMRELYGPRKVHIPKAPALGLLLEYPLFESYNMKVEATANSATEAERRDPITFEPHRAQMEEFKEAKIYSEIRAREAELNIFEGWLRSIDNYSGDDFKYLGAHGTIPAEAVYIRGAPRPNQFRDPRKDVPSAVAGDNDESDDEAAISKKDLAEMEG